MKRNNLYLFILLSALLFSLLPLYAKEKVKSYVYVIKRGGVYRYEAGNKDTQEPYVRIGMNKYDMIKLNDMKTLSSLNIDFEQERVKNIWISTKDIKTPGGIGIGNPIEEFKQYQTVDIEGTSQAYTPPYSGLVFCSRTDRGLIDIILVSSSSISGDIYKSASRNQPSVYVTNGNSKSVDLVMDEIINELFRTLNMRQCFVQDIILLPTRDELGGIYSLYGGPTAPVTSFCINEPGGSVIYILRNDEMNYKFRGILAHEYAHIWHYRLIGHNEADPVIREGFAEWVRYHYEGDNFQGRQEKEYKEGLNFFLDLEMKNGLQGVFDYLKKHS